MIFWNFFIKTDSGFYGLTLEYLEAFQSDAPIDNVYWFIKKKCWYIMITVVCSMSIVKYFMKMFFIYLTMFAHYFQFENQFLIDKSFAILELSFYIVIEILLIIQTLGFAVVEMEFN